MLDQDGCLQHKRQLLHEHPSTALQCSEQAGVLGTNGCERLLQLVSQGMVSSIVEVVVPESVFEKHPELFHGLRFPTHRPQHIQHDDVAGALPDCQYGLFTISTS